MKPSVHSGRGLILSPICFGDVEPIYDLCSRPETSRYSLWEPHKNRWNTIRYILFVKFRSDGLHWLAREAGSGRVVGSCSFVKIDWESAEGEIGYSVHPDLWHKGIGTALAANLLEYGFERLGLKRITARVMTENVHSLAVSEKVGMKRVEREDRFVMDGDIRREIVHLAIDARDYASARRKK